ncbi:hypothetical protein [Chryseobacterium caseinilyticum]|uniref:Uncharacterized protein n=1 Tax=Chryseobacterium caseinilyticum TaxID=2771428 RepID=A0ABR8Z738_9FLAO|nr:hypothetical protein [Chryseobacterium caseinilyticum]MBD8081113.1 hypothetical protein [Chryseobacterium caseinilyticum]
MDFKNFTLDSYEARVLLFRDVDADTSYPTVKIYCYWIDTEGDDRMHEETITFGNQSSAQSFIGDFSNVSAQLWFKNNVPFEIEAAS